MKDKNNLAVIDGETLMDMRLVPTKFCVDTLLPQGICILGGAPKIGKSWLVREDRKGRADLESANAQRNGVVSLP